MANEARNRLRSMGGIMASSPELLQAQQGAGVSPTVPVVGGPVGASSRMSPIAPLPPSRGRAPIQSPSSETPAVRRELGDTTLTFQDFLDLAREGESITPSDVERAVSAGEMTPQQEADIVSMMVDPGYVPSEAEQLAAEAPGLSQAPDARFPPQAPGFVGPIGDYFAGLTGATRGEIAEREETRSQLRSATNAARGINNDDRNIDDERAAATRRALDDLSGEAVPDRPQSDESTVDTTDDERAAATRRALEGLETQLDPAPDPADNTPKAKRTLRDRYDKRMELFKDIFGESDEARARDRAMSLAMMGLAIASGQDPNALTNIAQGAAAGLQGMSEQEQARREQERGLKTLAFETALEDMTAEEEARQEALKRRQDAALDLELARMDSGSGYGSRTDPATAYARFLGDLGKLASDPTSELYGANQSAIERSAYERLRTTYGDIPYVTELGQRLGVSPTNPVMSPEEAEAEANRLLE